MTTDATDWQSIRIEDADLQPRAVRALGEGGLTTLGEVDALTDVELLRIRDLGRMQMNRVRARIEALRRRSAVGNGEGLTVPDRLDEIASYMRRLSDVVRREISADRHPLVFADIEDPARIAVLLDECALELKQDNATSP